MHQESHVFLKDNFSCDRDFKGPLFQPDKNERHQFLGDLQKSEMNSISLIEILYLAGITVTNKRTPSLCPHHHSVLKTKNLRKQTFEGKRCQRKFVIISFSSEESQFLQHTVLWFSIKAKGAFCWVYLFQVSLKVT